jgi:hypothetical protein
LARGAPKRISSSTLLRLRSIGRVRDGGARDTPWGCGASDDDDVEVKGQSTSVYRSPNSSSSSIREREGKMFLVWLCSGFVGKMFVKNTDRNMVLF